MIKKYSQFFLYCIIFCCCLLLSRFSYAQSVISDSAGLINTCLKDATGHLKDVQQTFEDLNKGKQIFIEGKKLDSYKEKINDKISEAKDTISDGIKDTISGAGDEAGGTGAQTGETSAPGSSFLDSKTAKTVKGAFTAFGKVASPAAALVSGDLSGAVDLGKTLFVGKANSLDKLASYDAGKVQKNVKKYIQDATATTLGDVSQIISETDNYGKKDGTAQNANKEAGKSLTIREDIKTATDMGISMNVMTNTLLSMDITNLSVQSALIYEELNNYKNMNLRVMGLGG